MPHNVVLSDLIETDIFKDSGEYIGSIDELLIDPYTGIIRSILLMNDVCETIKLPWAAMRFDKSRQTFLLTPIGEAILKERRNKRSLLPITF